MDQRRIDSIKTETDKLTRLLEANTDLTRQDKDLTERVAELSKQIYAPLTERRSGSAEGGTGSPAGRLAGSAASACASAQDADRAGDGRRVGRVGADLDREVIEKLRRRSSGPYGPAAHLG